MEYRKELHLLILTFKDYYLLVMQILVVLLDLVTTSDKKPFKFPPPDGFQPLNATNVRPVKVISRPDQYVGNNLSWIKWKRSGR